MMAPGVRLPAFYDSRARETFDKELTKGRQYREHLKRNNPEQYILLKQRQREATRRYRERRREVLARLRGYSPRTRQPNDENREDYSPEELPFFAGARVAGLHQGARKSSDLDMFHVDGERASGVLCKVPQPAGPGTKTAIQGTEEDAGPRAVQAEASRCDEKVPRQEEAADEANQATIDRVRNTVPETQSRQVALLGADVVVRGRWRTQWICVQTGSVA
ncbi:hypothetical protein C0Q70_08952 [Pomacea canaliculata]|uniref:Uncharacterized protein n=1 Tax=Pomacea canaliculata TaxID=400727 RepID=A0A2T7P8G6_POMCA|nr:hypothetical protein C0Q70_08952 [Pomacea canaliculata]